MKKLLGKIRNCQICREHLPHGPRPVIQAHPESRIAIIGQAPGNKVHQSGIPWDDPSGDRLRSWMQVEKQMFYNEKCLALVPMGFCYPGKGRSGDLPPRPECAPEWHTPLFLKMKNLQLTLLIGQYAQKYYLRQDHSGTLTQNVRNYRDFLPAYLPLPHPSPRNIAWFKNNPWFEDKLLATLRIKVKTILEN